MSDKGRALEILDGIASLADAGDLHPLDETWLLNRVDELRGIINDVTGRGMRAATAELDVEALSGPSTHICWTPDATPREQRIQVVLIRESDRQAAIAALKDRERLQDEVSCLASLIREDTGGFLETVDGRGYLDVADMPLVTAILREARGR